jgi:hypothetical protein
MQTALSANMVPIECLVSYQQSKILNALHTIGILETIDHRDDGVWVQGKVPQFLKSQIDDMMRNDLDDDFDGQYDDYEFEDIEFNDVLLYDQIFNSLNEDIEIDWKNLAKGRHQTPQRKSSSKGCAPTSDSNEVYDEYDSSLLIQVDD